MTFIRDLLSRPDLLKNPKNIKKINKKVTVFERIRNDEKFQEEIRIIREKQL